jgi:hypothetical protein
LPPGSSCGSSAAGHEAPIRSCRQRTLQAWLAARHAVRSGHRASSMNRLAVAVTHLIGDAHAGSVVAASPVPDPRPCNHDFKRQRWFRSAARRYYRLWQSFVAPEATSVRPDRSILPMSTVRARHFALAAASLKRNSIGFNIEVISDGSLSLTRI